MKIVKFALIAAVLSISTAHAAYIGPPGTTPYSQLVPAQPSTLFGNPTLSVAPLQSITLGTTLGFSGLALQTGAGSGDCSWPANSFATTCFKLNGVAYPASPQPNTVPVVTGTNQVTYEQVPNAALQNSSITIAGHPVALGSSQVIAYSDLSSGAPLATPSAPGLVQPDGTTISDASGLISVNLAMHWRIGPIASPTIASNACGTTTQGAISADANDHDGKLTVGTASVTACSVTFSSAFSIAPRACQLTPANAIAAATDTTQAYVSDIETTGFVITGNALAGSEYYYHCM